MRIVWRAVLRDGETRDFDSYHDATAALDDAWPALGVGIYRTENYGAGVVVISHALPLTAEQRETLQAETLKTEQALRQVLKKALP